MLELVSMEEKKRIMSKNPTTTLEQQTNKFIYVNNPHQHNMESLEWQELVSTRSSKNSKVLELSFPIIIPN